MILLCIYFDFQELHSNIPIITTENEICPAHLKGTVAVVKYIPGSWDVCLFCIKLCVNNMCIYTTKSQWVNDIRCNVVYL